MSNQTIQCQTWNLELDDKLRRVKLWGRKEPKDLLTKMSVLEIKFGIKIAALRRQLWFVILRAGQTSFAQVMIIVCTIIEATHKRSYTLEDHVAAMHRQCWIQGNKDRTSKKKDDNGLKIALTDVNKDTARCYKYRLCWEAYGPVMAQAPPANLWRLGPPGFSGAAPLTNPPAIN